MGVNIEKVFGENVFDDAVMKVRLPKSDYETVKKLMYEGGEITEDLADVVAQAMKEWALEERKEWRYLFRMPCLVKKSER